jgi:hypothetical protein
MAPVKPGFASLILAAHPFPGKGGAPYIQMRSRRSVPSRLKTPPKRSLDGAPSRVKRTAVKAVRRRRATAQLKLFGDGTDHVWQRRFYDFNVWTARKRIEKLRYMHRNPVARGLVQEPEQWPRSSYRSYAFGDEGAVGINQWGEIKMKTPASAA